MQTAWKLAIVGLLGTGNASASDLLAAPNPGPTSVGWYTFVAPVPPAAPPPPAYHPVIAPAPVPVAPVAPGPMFIPVYRPTPPRTLWDRITGK